jgi:Mrp family chromosome partitioning ATPase
VAVLDADVRDHGALRVLHVDPPARPLESLTSAPVPLAVAGGGADSSVAVTVLRSRVIEGHGDVVRHNLRLLTEAYDLVLITAGPVVSDPVAFALLEEVTGVVLVVDAAGSAKSAGELPDFARRLELAGRACDGVVAVARRRSRARTEPPPARSVPPMAERPLREGRAPEQLVPDKAH